MNIVKKGKIFRQDLENWDGKSTTANRQDSTGGTISGLKIGTEVDVLSVYGQGTNYTVNTINQATTKIGSDNTTLVFSPGTWTIDSDLTIGSNFVCRIPARCVFNVSSGVTLTFSGPVIQDHATISSGSGTVTYNGTRTINGPVTITGNTVIDGNVTISGTTTLQDANDNEVLITDSVDSAVNEITVKNAATTANPTIQSSGEANTGLILADSNGNEVVILESVASAVNEITVTNAATGNPASVSVTGDDTNSDLELNGKGTGNPVNGRTVSGYVSGITEYLEGDVGANATSFSVSANIGAAWESVGPTGSGADNIWTALDDAPAGIKWVDVKLSTSLSGSTNGDAYTAQTYARVTGSSAGFDAVSRIGLAGFTNRSGSSETDSNMTSARIPVDSSGRFDLYLLVGGTGIVDTETMHLTGWGI